MGQEVAHSDLHGPDRELVSGGPLELRTQGHELNDKVTNLQFLGRKDLPSIYQLNRWDSSLDETLRRPQRLGTITSVTWQRCSDFFPSDTISIRVLGTGSSNEDQVKLQVSQTTGKKLPVFRPGLWINS